MRRRGSGFDKAFEVLSGMNSLELRMLQKGINTLVLARALDRHPDVRVNRNAVFGETYLEVHRRYVESLAPVGG